MAYPLQAKLLRVLQEGVIERVGSNKRIAVDVRVLSSTNRDLGAAIRADRFREDLYYRLNVFHIDLPPLRERREDVRPLVQHFLGVFARDLGKGPLAVTPDAAKLLEAYDWPGNVRELQNLMERAAVLCDGPEVDARFFRMLLPAAEPSAAEPAAESLLLEPAVEELERQLILRALVAADDNKAQAARLLGSERADALVQAQTVRPLSASPCRAPCRVLRGPGGRDRRTPDARHRGCGTGLAPCRTMIRASSCLLVVLSGLIATAATVRADVTGSYAGQLRIVGRAQPVEVAAALTQTGSTLEGTVVLGLAAPGVDGTYAVQGRVVGARFKLVGTNAGGTRLVWRGTVAGGGVGGRARVRGAQAHARGRLTVTLRATSGDGSNCDAVFTQNQAQFTSGVMDQVLVPICSGCHVAGGLAGATRLRVMRGDPLGTARAVALLVDQANPAASLILQKPLAAVPHGGGQQISAESPEAQALRQWADLVAQAGCNSGGGGAAAGAYAENCAGCHGTDGTGLSARQDIRCAVRSLVTDAVRRGRGNGAMPRFSGSTLPDARLDEIVRQLRDLCSGRTKDIYASNCASCHGPTAGGGRNIDGVFGPNIRCGGEDLGEALADGADRMPPFPELVGKAGSLSAYLGGLCSLGGGGGD